MLTITKKANLSGKLQTRTCKAFLARRSAYDAEVKRALPFIEKSEGDGCKNAPLKARWLNRHAVPAPTNENWTVDAVRRCLRRLKTLGLHQGNSPASACRVFDESQYARRINREKRFKQKRAVNRHLTHDEMVEHARAKGSTHVPAIALRIVEDEV
jgi:hypothetical protein